MNSKFASRYLPIVLWTALVAVGGTASYYFVNPSFAADSGDEKNQTKQDAARSGESAELTAFRGRVGKVTPVIVELREDPGAVMQFNRSLNAKAGGDAFETIAAYAVALSGKQNELLNALPQRNVRALMRTVDARQIDGSVRHVEYRFTYLLNGFIAYVADADLKRLKSQPEVLAVYPIEPEKLMLDNAINYSLGTQQLINDRRFSVYGANEELTPQTGVAGHPETPRLTALDGFEGQGINLAVIDSGVDWRHPMFGGTGLTTPTPRVSGNPATAADNRKVIYYYALSSPGNPTDDFGHGTLVSSTAAGFKTDGNTPANLGYGTGRDGTGIGPTINGATFHGTAPQARVMEYKVCGPAPQCLGDSALAMEDAASPYTLVQSGTTTPTPVAKPVADVINLSLGDTAGSATAASSKAANNAALNGTIVVASAGNAGPGAGTIGAPSAATLAISIAASLDPGSVAGSDLLTAGQVPAETNAGQQNVTAAGPAPETGAASTANQNQAPSGIKLFSVAGGGNIPNGSLSAHYVLNDQTAGNTVPTSVRNRIAVVRNFTGAFATAANMVAAQQPAAIILVTATESATAAAVVGGVPTYTISVANGNLLINQMLASGTPANGTVSQFPLRISEAVSLEAFTPAMASFSSRGPNDNATAAFRQIKPDVTAPGVSISGAATPTGLQEETTGLASPTGYVTANGTSFSGPITAGAMCLIRQRVRNQLGLDTVNLNDTNYRLKRFDTVTVSRALLQNSATNLRTGIGQAESDPAPTSSINDVGAGHINVAGALALRAIMVSPTLLLADADPSATVASEFTRPTRNAPVLDRAGNLEVMLPTASFAAVPVAGLQSTVVRTRKVIIRDVTGSGGGVYNLTSANNRSVDGTNFAVSFLAADNATPTTTVRVPSGGSAVYYVRTAANGANIAPDTEFQWYVTATHAATGQTLRMPFYYRAAATVVANIAAPVQTAPGAVPGTNNANGCPIDADGAYNINFTYTPIGGVNPLRFRVEEATNIAAVFNDPADTPVVNGANATFAGSAQWVSQVNPGTGSLAYFVPDAANQNEAFTQIAQVSLAGATGASLSFTTNQSTEEGFDFIVVEASGNNGATYNTLGSYSGVFNGTRELDLGPYAGGNVRIRFRMVSDLIGPDTGTYIENIRISTNNYTLLSDQVPNSPPLAIAVSGRTGTSFYRVAGLFASPQGIVLGPFSNSRCVASPSLPVAAGK